jgi:hypothetical protein
MTSHIRQNMTQRKQNPPGQLKKPLRTLLFPNVTIVKKSVISRSIARNQRSSNLNLQITITRQFARLRAAGLARVKPNRIIIRTRVRIMMQKNMEEAMMRLALTKTSLTILTVRLLFMRILVLFIRYKILTY